MYLFRDTALRRQVSRLAAAACLLVAAALSIGRAAAEDFEVGGLSFTSPAGWERVPPPNPMRKAMFRVPNPDGNDGAVTFYHFGPGRGGSAEANIERWYRQFKEPRDQVNARQQTKDLAGHRLSLFSASGTFLSGMPGGPTTEVPGHSLMAAVIEGPDGNVFIRFVAPTDLAEASASDFQTLVESPFGGGK